MGNKLLCVTNKNINTDDFDAPYERSTANSAAYKNQNGQYGAANNTHRTPDAYANYGQGGHHLGQSNEIYFSQP